MPHFDIVKQSDIKTTYRVARVMADYDVKNEHAIEHFVGDLEFPEQWHIGVIVGGSGTGKTTIANELFSDFIGGGISISHLLLSTTCRKTARWTKSRKRSMQSASGAFRRG